MHSRNRYKTPHDFPELARTVPELSDYFVTTPDGRLSLDFARPEAVRLLNKALLLRDYGLKHWDIPAGNLCPGVPGRLDYVHLLGDLLQEEQARPQGAMPAKKQRVRGLDVGTGASLIYPILAVREYGWRLVGSDIDTGSLKAATAIAKFNPVLTKHVELRQQPDPKSVFQNVIRPGEYFDFTMCNPPFFTDAQAAVAAANEKWKKLGVAPPADLNFGGRANELWTEGGEPDFLRRMIRESVHFGRQVGWFTTLVSKKGYLKIAEQEFGRAGITTSRVLGMGRGGKVRRVLAWRVVGGAACDE